MVQLRLLIFRLLVCLWTFKCVGEPLVGDFGCAVFIVESTNPKNLDLNKTLNLIIIAIEILNLNFKI